MLPERGAHFAMAGAQSIVRYAHSAIKGAQSAVMAARGVAADRSITTLRKATDR